MTPEGFYTLKGYARSESAELTSAMEDYLEMIARLGARGEPVRAGALSRLLHVRPPSVTKMVQQLVHLGFLDAEKYGVITLTDKGREAGSYLLYRHAVLNRFLCALNGTASELEQVEKIEHFLNRATIENLDRLTRRMLSG